MQNISKLTLTSTCVLCTEAKLDVLYFFGGCEYIFSSMTFPPLHVMFRDLSRVLSTFNTQRQCVSTTSKEPCR